MIDTEISNAKKLIKIYVRNDIKDGIFTIGITKRDRNDRDETLEGAKFEIKVPGEEGVRQEETNILGKILLPNLDMPADGQYIYIE